MYRDLNFDDCMKFEKLLGKLECIVATFVQKILSEPNDISLKRTDVTDFKKFLFIMMYRHENRRNQYYDEKFDHNTRLSLQNHMRSNNIKNVREVWFENLKWIIETPLDDVNKELSKVRGIMGLIESMSHKWPIHVVELMDYGHVTFNYICVWKAQEGSEFILSDNCFGCYEGQSAAFPFHHFYVVSPQYAVVLVNRLYMMDGAIQNMGFRKSWFEEFHAIPNCVYVNKNMRGKQDFSPNDVFTYQRIVIPKQKVWLVNSIFLDARHKSLSHKSNAAMYRSLVFYEKVKDELFTNKHDYSVLKRQLFVEMNRTHSA
ncbi:hypothetical protein BGZ79_004624 [Entomortierella chlamydospora]|nr:hypothetical protein BGZ79_004624 [Entomortierella chlamydospora]